MKFVDFLNEEVDSNTGKTKDGLNFKLGETSATVEFFDQFGSNYNLFSEIYNDDKLHLGSNDTVRYGYKLDAETAKNILANSAPRKYVSKEIARYIAINTMLESKLTKLDIGLRERSIKKNGKEIHIVATKKYDRNNVLGTLVFHNKGLIDIELKIGKTFKKVDINSKLNLTNYEQLALDIKEALESK